MAAETYAELVRILTASGFRRLQGSDWVSDDSDAVHAYWTMLSLTMVEPPGKLESTVKGLKAHHIPDWVFDITEEIQLGGLYSPFLPGPTPARLVPQNVPCFPPVDPILLPQHTQPSPQAQDTNNWRVSF